MRQELKFAVHFYRSSEWNLYKMMRAQRRFKNQAENSFAMPNAAAAASPPMIRVCNDALHGVVPVKRPLMYPKRASATNVTPMETLSALRTFCNIMYGKRGTSPPST